MKGIARNMYPGGNTPIGFHSYYTHILPQRKAKKIFCIKGGPGVGKSTIMKDIAKYFLEKGEDVDFLWCSSDPGSVDGILLKKRAIALIDGTAPHIVDPKNPGAVDEIINLGMFWDEDGIKEQRNEIISCGEKISEVFDTAYGYLKCAWQQYEFMGRITKLLFSDMAAEEAKRQLHMKMSSNSVLRRTEYRVKKESALGVEIVPGKRKKAFATAITPMGIRNELETLIQNTPMVIVLDVPTGFRAEFLLKAAAARLISAGFDIEEFYCPMDPECKLEHIISPKAQVAIISSNRYHSIDMKSERKKIMKIEISLGNNGLPRSNADNIDSQNADDERLLVLEDLQQKSEENILRAIEHLQTAKRYHDILEGFYIPNMDFEKLNMARNEIIGKIEAEMIK